MSSVPVAAAENSRLVAFTFDNVNQTFKTYYRDFRCEKTQTPKTCVCQHNFKWQWRMLTHKLLPAGIVGCQA
jgi:hypothetical protein